MLIGLEDVCCDEGSEGGCEEEEEEEEDEVAGGEVEGRVWGTEETGTAVRGLEGGAAVILTEFVAVTVCVGWEVLLVGVLLLVEEMEEEEEVLEAGSFGRAVVGVAVGGATGFPEGREVGVSLRCLPLTMSARLETVCSLPLEEGGRGAEPEEEPPARGGKWAGEWSMAFWGD